jgi:uncharacterized protein (TIGR00106 family)
LTSRYRKNKILLSDFCREDGKDMAIVEVSVIPVGTKTPSLGRYVAGVLRVLQDEKSIKYKLTPMGTIIEGDLKQVLPIVQKMHQAAFAEEVLRVVTTISIDERRDKPLTMESKVRGVEEKLKEVRQR